MFDNPELLKVWIWCLFKATHDDYAQMVGLQEVYLEKGQFVFGMKVASSELKMSESKTYRLIKKLENMQNLNIKTNNKFSVITIENWGLYQSDDCKSEQQSEQQMNNKRTTNEQQMNTNKNDKNDKKEKNNTNSEMADTKKINYKEIYDYFVTLNIVQSKGYSNGIRDAIKKAMTTNNYDTEYCKTLLYRHKQVVDITSNHERPVQPRDIQAFFGQRAYQASHLICTEYAEGGKYYEKYIKPEEIKQNRVPFKPTIVYVNEG